jgi:NodT family efflux transporter outer membrane factor (OMF) lipoprotein
MKQSLKHAVSLALISACMGCAVGPDYVKPVVQTPAAWHPEAPFQTAQPQDNALKGDWWTLFNDPALSGLEQKAAAANPTLKSAFEHYTQSVAQLGEVKSAEMPSIGLGAEADRTRISNNRPTQDYNFPTPSTVQNNLQLGVQASYEVDLFGRVRREVEASKADSEQSKADFQNMELVIAAEVATTYFQLRELDEETAVVDSMVHYEQAALKFVSSRYRDGDASGLDLNQQQAELQATTTQRELLAEQRARAEHALATLTGTPAPEFQLAAGTMPTTIPAIPVGLPSTLLQRRPDIAAAERAVAAANARIGVARSAYYPNIVLSPAMGFESVAGGSLFTAGSLLWSIGGSAFENVFDGGKIVAMNRFAEAGYRASVDDYSATVLKAFQEVQDGMSSMNYLGRAADESVAATGSANHVLSIATERYKDGLANYLDVIDAQQSLLTQRRLNTTIRGEQLAQSVFLIKALGGGWSASSAPSVAQRGGHNPAS